MALTYTGATFSDREVLLHSKLNTYFTDISSKFDANIVNADVSASAAIAGSKLDLTSNTGRITQISSLSGASTASCSLVNTGNGGVLKITNSGTGAEIFTDAATFTIDLDNNADGTGETFKVTKNAGATTLFQIDQNGAVTFTAQTKYYSVSPVDFIGQTGADLGSSIEQISTNGEYVIANNTTAATVLIAPVHLKNGSVVTNFNLYYSRDNATATLTVALNRITLSDSTVTAMASVTATSEAGTVTSVADATIASATIDNSLYQYVIAATFDNNAAGSEQKIYGAVITYTVAGI